MFPWWWFWAPQLHLPFSGSVAQSIEPNVNWFFDAIRPEAGVGDVEQQIVDVASYGRQLGLVMEVLLAHVREGAIDATKAADSLDRLEETYRKIEQVKSENSARLAEAAIALLNKLRASDRAEFCRVLRRYAGQAGA